MAFFFSFFDVFWVLFFLLAFHSTNQLSQSMGRICNRPFTNLWIYVELSEVSGQKSSNFRISRTFEALRTTLGLTGDRSRGNGASPLTVSRTHVYNVEYVLVEKNGILHKIKNVSCEYDWWVVVKLNFACCVWYVRPSQTRLLAAFGNWKLFRIRLTSVLVVSSTDWAVNTKPY